MTETKAKKQIVTQIKILENDDVQDLEAETNEWMAQNQPFIRVKSIHFLPTDDDQVWGFFCYITYETVKDEAFHVLRKHVKSDNNLGAE